MSPTPTKLAATLTLALAAGCSGDRADAAAPAGENDATASIEAQRAADMLYAVIEADRKVYTQRVVDRLTRDTPIEIADPDSGELRPLVASERWQSEPGSLPLPSSMFKMAADDVSEQQTGLHYALISEWPIGSQNRAQTEAEERGLAAVRETQKPHYDVEDLGDRRYLTAVYPDVAVAEACVDCHNAHPDSPRTDFELGDVMGGVVVRLELSP